MRPTHTRQDPTPQNTSLACGRVRRQRDGTAARCPRRGSGARQEESARGSGPGPAGPAARRAAGGATVARESDRWWREESGRTRTSALKGPLSSRGQRTKFYQFRVKSALKRDVSPAHGRPRPELDIGLYSGHPSPGIRIWDRRSGPVVDGSGPRQDVPLGA